MSESSSRADGPTTMPSIETGWWEQERAVLIRDRVDALVPTDGRVLDVGCGRGTMFDDPRFASRLVVHVDSHAWDEWRERGGVYVCATADALPFRDGAFDLVGSYDVLEHLDDDLASLVEQRRVTSEHGHLAIAVPADRRLWSHHDDAVGHRRRYGSDDLRRLARSAGLDVVRLTHFYSFLWLPAWATRRSALRTSEPGNSVSLVARIARRAVSWAAGGERRLLRRRNVPFGTSLWAECRTRGS